MTGIVRLRLDVRWQRENTDNLRRQKNVLSESCKNHYNAYNENKIQKACNNKLKQVLTILRYSHLKTYIESLCEKFNYTLAHFEIVDLRKEKTGYLTGGLYLLDF